MKSNDIAAWSGWWRWNLWKGVCLKWRKHIPPGKVERWEVRWSGGAVRHRYMNQRLNGRESGCVGYVRVNTGSSIDWHNRPATVPCLCRGELGAAGMALVHVLLGCAGPNNKTVSLHVLTVRTVLYRICLCISTLDISNLLRWRCYNPMKLRLQNGIATRLTGKDINAAPNRTASLHAGT